MRNIINIINFVRGSIDPRFPTRDNVATVKNQLALMDEHSLTGTFLLEYDALIKPEYTSLFDGTRHEIGGWFETVQPLVEDSGLVWRGRDGYSWDWFANVGTMSAYMPRERELLIDCFMNKFKEIFGYIPLSVGAWVWDAHSLRYLKERYGVKAACICKEQYGTDGYTLWGGYYNGGYYPSENNALSPAPNGEKQIVLPVFRMLGIDPVDQYDYGMNFESDIDAAQDVITLEPSCNGVGGADPAWVDWYFTQNFGKENGSYAYAQVGQENGMSWESMKDGLRYQFCRLNELKEKLDLHIEKLSETGEWFSRTYSITPQSVCFCDNDSANSGKKSFWYNCSKYRVNFFSDKDGFRVRDLYVFSSEQKGRYLYEPCLTESCAYYTLPVIDGNRWSGNGIRAGIYFRDAESDEKVLCSDMAVTATETEAKAEALTERFGKIVICCKANGEISVCPEKNYSDLRLRFCCDRSRTDILRIRKNPHTMCCRFGNVDYGISLFGGVFSEQCDEICLCENRIIMCTDF